MKELELSPDHSGESQTSILADMPEQTQQDLPPNFASLADSVITNLSPIMMANKQTQKSFKRPQRRSTGKKLNAKCVLANSVRRHATWVIWSKPRENITNLARPYKTPLNLIELSIERSLRY